MKRNNLFRRWPQAGYGLAMLAASLYVASIAYVSGADTQSVDHHTAHSKAVQASLVKSGTANPQPAPKTDPKPKEQLTGSELYSMNCSRCHAERYPTEFTPGQWKTIMLEMRVRADLPAKQARKILKYLQENSGS